MYGAYGRNMMGPTQWGTLRQVVITSTPFAGGTAALDANRSTNDVSLAEAAGVFTLTFPPGRIGFLQGQPSLLAPGTTTTAGYGVRVNALDFEAGTMTCTTVQASGAAADPPADAVL
jgi:hypothetical protein